MPNVYDRLREFDRIPLYAELLASRAGYIIVGRFAPAAIFALILSAKTNGLLAWLVVQQVDRNPIHFYLMFAYQLLVLIFLATVSLLFIVRHPIKKSSSRLSTTVVALGGTFITTPLAFAPVSIANTALLFLSISLMLAGMLVSLAALITLGRCFGISPHARALVTIGPYRFVRHPLYVGEEVGTLGLLLPVISPFTAGVFILHCVLQFLRARYEERLLTAVFPEYMGYSHRVARFIPHVY